MCGSSWGKQKSRIALGISFGSFVGGCEASVWQLQFRFLDTELWCDTIRKVYAVGIYMEKERKLEVERR